MARTLNSLYHLMRADFLERARRTSFLVIAGLTVYACYAFVPPAEADFASVVLSRYRGIYNSAWVGTMFGFAASLILSLFAFYLVKNTIERDRRTRVGRVIATTPIRNLSYVYGKWLSNLALLAAILLILTVMALVMQLVRGESTQIDPLALAAPIWLMGLPVLALVAALAVLFESIRPLSGGFGNVVYFFAWVGGLAVLLSGLMGEAQVAPQVNDVFGMTRPLSAMQAQVAAMDPDYSGGFSIGRTDVDLQVELFDWPGVDWTPAVIGGRLLWLLAAAAVAGAAALPFDRFDPARRRAAEEAQEGEEGRTRGVRRLGPRIAAVTRRVSPLAWLRPRSRFGQLWLAELRLLLYGQRWWWYAVLASLWLAGLVSPVQPGLENVLPFLWLWPVLVWSPLGARERLEGTERLVFSGPQPVLRQLPAAWLAGVTLAAAAGSSVALRLALAGQWGHVLGWLAGALFIPSLALALGAWSGGSRLFEIVYLLWWYMAVNGGVAVDFMSRTAASLEAGMPWVYLGASAALLAAAAAGRWRRLRG